MTANDRYKEFQNPVIEPDFADPTVIRGTDGLFYAYSTETDWSDGQGRRQVPILRSPDLIDWKYVGDAFHARPTWFPPGVSIWAPDISCKNGTYYLFYSISIWGDHEVPAIGVATAPHPAGPFVDQGPVIRSMEIGVYNSIDPMHFVDEDGSSYLIWGSFSGIYGVPLADDALSVSGEKFPIAGNKYEAAQIHKHAGMYYAFLSAGTCCDGENSTYHVRVGRASAIQGPYLDREGVDLRDNGGSLLLGGMPDVGEDGERYVAPGHHCLIRDDAGTDWIVYHAIDVKEPYLPVGWSRRPTLIDPIEWVDGWPTVKKSEPNPGKQSAPLVHEQA